VDIEEQRAGYAALTSRMIVPDAIRMTVYPYQP